MNLSASWQRIAFLGLLLLPRMGFAQEPPASPPLQADTISRIVEQVEPSVVSILRVRQPANEGPPERLETPLPRDPEEREVLPNDYGAGLLVKPADGNELFVLTAYHVVRGGMEFQGD